MLKFSPKIRLGILINVMLINKKHVFKKLGLAGKNTAFKKAIFV